jgi:hypothetical protein
MKTDQGYGLFPWLKINWNWLHCREAWQQCTQSIFPLWRSHHAQWQANRLLWWRSRCKTRAQEWLELSNFIQQVHSCYSRRRSKLLGTWVFFTCWSLIAIPVTALHFSKEGEGGWITLTLWFSCGQHHTLVSKVVIWPNQNNLSSHT